MAMDQELRQLLTNGDVPAEVIAALALAMDNSYLNNQAAGYARGMYDAFKIYGRTGLEMNILYLLGNMNRWQGDAARSAKRVLRQWADSKK